MDSEGGHERGDTNRSLGRALHWQSFTPPPMRGQPIPLHELLLMLAHLPDFYSSPEGVAFSN